ncbi:hypothetical protein CDO73_04995 [Saccharibacillus sp. O23]|nr:hypothetical protein CDO73_04995 [Saccharibacillus sp. O23]
MPKSRAGSGRGIEAFGRAVRFPAVVDAEIEGEAKYAAKIHHFGRKRGIEGYFVAEIHHFADQDWIRGRKSGK